MKKVDYPNAQVQVNAQSEADMMAMAKKNP
jgi:hypothetical protein